MGLISKQEFAESAGINTKELAVYISRGKVIANGKKIDPNLPENKEFVDDRKQKLSRLKEKTTVEPTDPKEIVERAQAYARLNKLNTSRKEMEIERMNEEIELYRLKKMKLQGKLIPTDIVEILVAQFSKGIYIATAQGIEEIIFSIGKKKSLSRRRINWEQLSVLWKP